MCFSCANVPVKPLPLPVTGRKTGIDVGLQVCLVTADGDLVEKPRHSRKAEHTLKKVQKRVSRRKKGGTRRTKVVKLLAKAHQHVKRQREDFHHKTALALVRQYDAIYVEAIQPANVSRRPEPKPDENGNFERNGGRPEGRPQPRNSGRRVGPLPLDPRLQGSMRREAGGSGQPGVHVPGLLGL